MEGGEEGGDVAGFGGGDDGGDGEGELGGVDAFADGVAAVVPFGVAFLAVRGDGVVDEGLHTVVGQVALQFVAAGGEDGEDVEYVGIEVGDGRQLYQRVADLREVDACDRTAVEVVGIKMRQLRPQHGGLYFIETRIETLVFEYVFAVGTVVGECADGGGEEGVVGGDDACVAQCSEVFAGVETVAGGVAKGARAPTLEEAPVGLGVVFD